MIATAWCAIALMAYGSAPAAAVQKTNVLLLISDDLNTDLGCYGHPLVKSPHIDELAERGVRFDRAYCQAPVCNPSRASLFSGLLPGTIGVVDNYTAWPDRPDRSRYLPDFFRSQGYFTGTIGKVLDHKRVPDQPFWDLEIREWGKHPRQEQIVEKGPSPSGIGYWAILDAKDEATGDGDVARKAVEALTKQARREKPFFLAAGFRRPHSPYAAPARDFEHYPPERITLPETPQEHLENILPAADSGYPYVRKKAARALRAYYAAISFMDAQVGIIMEHLDQLGLWENTVVIFASDHGYHTGHHGMWHKQTLFEQSARVPLIIVAPGRKQGVVCRRTVELVDLYPTLADLCGLQVPEVLQGSSLVPLLDDPGGTWDQPALTVEGRVDRELKKTIYLGHSLRTERFRYTEWDGGNRGRELYDRRHDPNEFSNLANDPAHADTIERLKKLLHTRRRAR